MKTRISDRPRFGFLVLALAGSMAYAMPAMAQDAGPQGGGGAPNAQSAQGSQAGSRTARVEEQINRLHQELGITSAQSQQWNALAQVMRENAQHMDSLYQQRVQSIGTMNALEDLKSYQQAAQAHVEDVNRLVPAFQTLYDSLSQQQKQTADQIFRQRAEHRHQHPLTHHE